MKTILCTLSGILMTITACGDNQPFNSKESISQTAARPLALTSAPSDVLGLTTDEDVKIESMQAWLDLMPGIGNSPTHHTHMQVRFTANSMGCTRDNDFKGNINLDNGRQILVIKRITQDNCLASLSRREINISVSGTYDVGKPVFVNGQEIPVFESIVN